jgi:hypothetical protein
MVLREEDLKSEGMLNLLNKGAVPRDIDIGPAFLKG